MGIPATLSSVPAQTPYVQYIATASQTVFPYPFEITQDSDLVVVVNGVTLSTDQGYTLSGQGNSTGGNLTFTLGRSANDIVTMFRDIPIQRISQIAQNSGFSSTVFNAEFNNIYLILQQLSESLGFALQVPNTNSPAPVTTLLPANYANKYLAFDGNGNPTPALLTSSGALTMAIIAGLLNPQITAEFNAGVTPTSFQYQPYDLRRYGADPTGVSTSDAAMTSAISVCGTTGGTIRAPAGLYKFANAISLKSKVSIVIQGDGTTMGGAQAGTQLQYTGTGSGIWITMDAATGVRFQKLQLIHSSASFTGTYISCKHSGNDPTFCGLDEVSIGATTSSTTHLNLDSSTLFSCTDVIFTNGLIQGQKNDGTSYSNVISFDRCLWTGCPSAPVQDGGQAWSFTNCTAEQLSTGAPGFLVSTAPATSQFVGLTVQNCWLGDATAVAGSWFNISAQGANITGNYISTTSGVTTGTGITLVRSAGVAITANLFQGLLNGIQFLTTASADIVVQGNVASSVTNPWVGTSTLVTIGTLVYSGNFGFGIPSGHGTGTFTVTLTGCTTAPTATARWSQSGNIIVLTLPVLTATSNATGLTLTGLPTNLQPANTYNCAVAFLEDAGSGTAGAASVSNASGTITFFKGSSTSAASWTGSGTKGIAGVCTITYALD